MAFGLILLLAACGADETAEEQDEDEKENEVTDEERVNISIDDWEVETVAANLSIPWDINYSDGQFIMTEREGYIVTVNEDREIDRSEVETSDPVHHEGEAGLLGMVLDDDFSQSSKAFLYYTYKGENGLIFNRVVSVLREGNDWIEQDIVLDDIPGDRIHNGGRIAIGPDGYLYVTTGDANNPELSQEPEDLAGNILRMTLDGEIPEDNPLENSYVYSYGHRNPQGMAWSDNTLYSSEHGPVAHDEINIIEAGKNYGWPVIEGDEEAADMESPLVHSGEETWAPSGMTWWNDTLIVAGLRGGSLYQMDEDSEEMIVIFEGEGRIRDVFAHEGELYVITNNTDGRGNPQSDDDRLLRLTLSE